MMCLFIHLFIIYSHLERMCRRPWASTLLPTLVDPCPHQITHELLIELALSDSYRQQEAHHPLKGEHSEQSLQGMIPIRHEP